MLSENFSIRCTRIRKGSGKNAVSVLCFKICYYTMTREGKGREGMERQWIRSEGIGREREKLREECDVKKLKQK